MLAVLCATDTTTKDYVGLLQLNGLRTNHNASGDKACLIRLGPLPWYEKGRRVPIAGP